MGHAPSTCWRDGVGWDGAGGVAPVQLRSAPGPPGGSPSLGLGALPGQLLWEVFWWLDGRTLLSLVRLSPCTAHALGVDFWRRQLARQLANGCPVPRGLAARWAPPCAKLSKESLKTWALQLGAFDSSYDGAGPGAGAGAGADLAAGRLLRLCAALSALCLCPRCGVAEVSESGTCTICYFRAKHDLIDRVGAGLAEASRLRYAPVWRLCSSGHFGAVPELSRLALAYSLRACGSSLRTLHAEVLHRKQSLLVLQVRNGCASCRDGDESSSDSDASQQPLQFVGAFLPFAWPWSPSPGRGGSKGRRGGGGGAAAAAGTSWEGCSSSALWLFHISIARDGGTFPTVWPLAMGELRPWERMHASVEGGLLIGGTNPGAAALAVTSDLEHGCLALPSSALSGACGDGARSWRQGGLGSCHMPWDFEVVDVEVWADECAFEEEGLPFEFEYRNQQLNKRITKTVLGGLNHRSIPL